ncbi:tripartite tricarboxylate transporter TctB family protein [Tianweitania sp. BSSL-BM11]|uniref:Tripartite tricarboxylate transporter TctB family protein n=1 Tax=Tianweitania aestuarii TaxID=2814886 RepID=A0ABS5RYF7_9HYPH|nr:tripartite tricarboxylate transporter TctB family protein [Tianweitania aestuarii]MBS9722076.1 tripartite tricarboxylate transporter TctB family protein [Tianweitania aestuarii]
MNQPRKTAVGDLLLAAGALIGAGLLFWGASELPPPRFEPLGSAALPRILGVCITVLALIIAAGAALGGKRHSIQEPDAASDEVAAADASDLSAARPLQTIAVLAALIVYVAALDVFRVPFVLATTILMAALGAFLGVARLRTAITIGITGVLLALAIQFVFERYLYVTIG